MRCGGGGESGGASSSAAAAVAVRRNSRSSRRAVRWAIENLMPQSHQRLILIHVMPPIATIPTPSGTHVLIKEMDADVVAIYKQDMKLKLDEIFLPFIKLCKTGKMERLVLEDNNPADALVRFMSESGCKSLVLSPSNCITRRLRGPDVPSTVMKIFPNTFNIYVISRYKIHTKLLSPSSAPDNSVECQNLNETALGKGSSTSSPSCANDNKTLNVRLEDSTYMISQASTSIMSEDHQETVRQNSNNGILDIQKVGEHDSKILREDSNLSEFQDELEQLRLELRSTLVMYDRACQDLVNVQRQVRLLSSECLQESRKVNNIAEREHMLVKVAAMEKAKHIEAMQELEMAKQLLAKEVHERQIAEFTALQLSSEKQIMIETLLSNDKRYRRYTREEIEVATDFFSDSKMIGEGGYGKVYKCSLDHTPVAIKVLHPDSSDRREEFLREVEVLSQLRHPNLVLLLGACPEIGCLVYEYMENGSLEECLHRKEGTTPLPWFIRFRIVYDVARGLSFLHGSEPEPIIHRDLKPGNILLDKNYRSKIGDVGLAKLVSDVVPDNVTAYNDSILLGTFYYMDPEYHRTGTIRPKSDIYALGIIILQLLTARGPNGLIMTVEKAINSGCFVDVLDKSITDWPLPESQELARIALECSRLRCRDRPDLEHEILPILEKLLKMADDCVELRQRNICTPNHYFCPITQEIMDEPYITADGFTYEYRAIKAWLDKHDVSPVTRLKLPNSKLTPNNTLHAAIKEWKSHVNQKGEYFV
ncbi:hypothetical protein Syun_026448 [Stephania yunnanensis]|uniref:RING-type E3 ubiquitin transferase n=1 Tax=Stephania yunnanensis TaxID=152371 RepID=A0AAP0HS67_9MAGN